MRDSPGNDHSWAHLSPELLVELADGRLSPVERRLVERHLAGCPACRADLEMLEDDAAHGSEALPSLDATADESRAYALVTVGGALDHLQVAASTSEGLPDPDDGCFLSRFREAGIEVYGFDRVDGYWLALYFPSDSGFRRVRAPGLGEERTFPTGWVGRVEGAGERRISVEIDCGDRTWSLLILPAGGPAA